LNPIGRPTKYDPKYIDLVISLMELGWSKTRVAAYFRVHKDTLYEWIKQHPDFSDAVRVGETLSEAWWEEQGVAALTSKEYNTNMFKWLTSNIHGWTDKQSQDINMKGELNIGSRIESSRRRTAEIKE
jgi:hypothetical protein